MLVGLMLCEELRKVLAAGTGTQGYVPMGHSPGDVRVHTSHLCRCPLGVRQ